MERQPEKCPVCGNDMPPEAKECPHCNGVEAAGIPEAAKVQKKKKPARRAACLVLIAVGGIFVILLLLGVAMYLRQMIADRPREVDLNEAIAMQHSERVAEAEEAYYTEAHEYGALEALIEKELLPKEFAGEKLDGYSFELELSEDGQDYWFRMWPSSCSGKSYYMGSTGEMRSKAYAGPESEKAGPDSPMLWDDDDWGD